MRKPIRRTWAKTLRAALLERLKSEGESEIARAIGCSANRLRYFRIGKTDDPGLVMVEGLARHLGYELKEQAK